MQSKPSHFQTTAESHARFELFDREDGKSYFQLRAANGAPVLASRAFDSRAEALHGIAQVMEMVSEDGALRLQRKVSVNFKFYFVVQDAAGQTLGWSGLFETRRGRENGIRALRRAAADGRVHDRS